MIHRYDVDIAANSGGDATVYAGQKINGRVHAILYQPGTIETGGDLTITGETTGVPILVKANAGTSNVWYYPRVVPNKNTDGEAFTDVAEQIFVLRERIKIVLEGGGNATSGKIAFFIDE